MKRFLRSLLLLTLVLCMGAGIALADTYYVKPDIESPLSLRDAATNDVLTVIPAGTANANPSTRPEVISSSVGPM